MEVWLISLLKCFGDKISSGGLVNIQGTCLYYYYVCQTKLKTARGD